MWCAGGWPRTTRSTRPGPGRGYALCGLPGPGPPRARPGRGPPPSGGRQSAYLLVSDRQVQTRQVDRGRSGHGHSTEVSTTGGQRRQVDKGRRLPGPGPAGPVPGMQFNRRRSPQHGRRAVPPPPVATVRADQPAAVAHRAAARAAARPGRQPRPRQEPHSPGGATRRTVPGTGRPFRSGPPNSGPVTGTRRHGTQRGVPGRCRGAGADSSCLPWMRSQPGPAPPGGSIPSPRRLSRAADRPRRSELFWAGAVFARPGRVWISAGRAPARPPSRRRPRRTRPGHRPQASGAARSRSRHRRPHASGRPVSAPG